MLWWYVPGAVVMVLGFMYLGLVSLMIWTDGR